MFLQAPLPANYSRIISLVPSQSELLYDLGMEEKVVGITKFCVHPEKWFREKKRVGGTKMIHTDVIHGLSPDLIIANKEENVQSQIEDLAKKYPVWLTDVHTLSEATDMILDIGKLCDAEISARRIVSQIQQEFQILHEEVKDRKPVNAAYFIWKSPLMVCGSHTFIHDMMERCGILNSFGKLERYPTITREDVIASNCKHILLSSEPYPFREKHREEFSKLFPGINVRLVDGEMFSWYGSRLIRSARYFRKVAHLSEEPLNLL